MTFVLTQLRKKLSGVFLVAGLLGFSLPLAAQDILVLGLFKDMVIFQVDEVKRKLRLGETSPEGIRLISATSEAAVLEIDGRRQTYTLGVHPSTRSFAREKPVTEARIWANKGMYVTSGLINGTPVSLLVDTGATWVAMNTEHAKRLGINYRYEGTPSTASTAGGVVRTYAIKLKSVKVGEIELQDIDAAVVEGNGPQTILLGMSFLNRVKMQREGRLLLLRHTQ